MTMAYAQERRASGSAPAAEAGRRAPRRGLPAGATREKATGTGADTGGP